MVLLIKAKDLVGREIRVQEPGVRIYWFRVERVTDADAPTNKGKVFWFYGTKVRQNGKPSTAKDAASPQFLTPRKVVDVR